MSSRESIVENIFDTFCVVTINVLLEVSNDQWFGPHRITFIAERLEYDKEFGPMRTTGDFWCASRRALDRNPL